MVAQPHDSARQKTASAPPAAKEKNGRPFGVVLFWGCPNFWAGLRGENWTTTNVGGPPILSPPPIFSPGRRTVLPYLSKDPSFLETLRKPRTWMV